MFNNEKVAGLKKRIPAMLIDGMLLSIPSTIIAAILFGANQIGYTRTSTILLGLYLVLVPLMWNGMTIGKKIMKLQIVKADGEKPTLATLVIRFVAYYGVNVLIVGLGVIVNILVIGIRKDNRGIHDLIAGTYVREVKN